MKEIWKDVVGYEGLYQVSNLGRVRSLERIARNNHKIKEKILTPQLINGYLCVHFRKNNSSYTPLIHRLVAQAFLQNPNNLPQVNHKDEDKTNNNVSNLEWCDSKYNNNYGTKNEKISIKLTNRKDLSKVVIQIDKNTNVVINIFPSLKEAERQTGYNHSHIQKCCKGKLKTTGGYKWSYKESQG